MQNLSITVFVLQYLLFSFTDILVSKLHCADVSNVHFVN